MGEDVSVRVQDVQPLGFPVMGAMSSSPRRHRWWGHGWGYHKCGIGPQEAVLGVGWSQKEAFMEEEAQTPKMIPQDWAQRVEGVHRQTADEGGQPLGEWFLCCPKSFSC